MSINIRAKPKFIFILGGVRSGKSSYAVELAKKLNKKVTFIATAICFDNALPSKVSGGSIPMDKEMEKRIKLHKSLRPRHWKLIEEGRDVGSVLCKLDGKSKVVLIDCLGLLISNFLADKLSDKEIKRKIKELINVILKIKFTVILVSNEVGAGLVAVNPLARRFQDLLGLANQMMAKSADEVIFMQAGIPIRIKEEEQEAKNRE
ncbi:MAG: bifunctional adenosylcobinamide kinase/adenosylcobinamide-phosphate guanylyltransferase [Candidatus Omnitrophica bacterium]|nr:bifunctional adenosylcobinamide kinase/adenosylcobinamide-phosphate guanylyltransferase [Candidatus Omnitrophota bacterium]MBU0897092.1 bifunctional adenosylcobinamide kinase/adenosylcobinamide-phosphate guanylyltransferase [Candidatus Omnitrophota bacterium]MBU1133870.1 bifunctional adenosylcobinamide kinase/adenosylcobinamide-phosphate guanylyltransferase [Candidatus Omnitrophota bacterium]MBU1809780.1 bifunctional adenosylcobinamide kinase/adenosylcobinamide-phosphate guanylyltransferase [